MSFEKKITKTIGWIGITTFSFATIFLISIGIWFFSLILKVISLPTFSEKMASIGFAIVLIGMIIIFGGCFILSSQTVILIGLFYDFTK